MYLFLSFAIIHPSIDKKQKLSLLMTIRRKIWLVFIGIIILTALAVIIDIPKGPDLAGFGKMYREFKVHLGLDLQGGTSLTYEADVSQVPSEDQQDALDGLRNVIENRINQFGVAEPSIRLNQAGDMWRVLIELPGITDINAAIAQIGETPLLEFREEAETPVRTEEEKAAIRAKNEEQKIKAEEVLGKALEEGSDFTALAKEYSEDTGSAENGGDLDFFRKGMMIPAFEEAAFSGEIGKVIPELVQTDFGYHIIKVTDKRTVEEDGQQIEEVRASHILFQTEPEEIQPSYFPNYTNTDLNGGHLQHAQVTFNPNTNEPEVSIEFDSEGTALFKAITEKNVGKTVAIYLDGEIISAPVVNDVIPNGQAVIQGNFTLDEAKDLTRRLNAGALPVPVTLINQQNVGPTLGEIALQKSLFAGIIGLALLSFFMIVYYRLPGILAVIALGIYGLLILAIFKALSVTLSLAGVAGFILSMGMAVDANILIFERMKEEIYRGRSLSNAIEDGFSRAWLSIRDSNASSLISCVILGTFGSSIIKGFAVTLGIGIAVSMFSAITITRTFLRLIGGRILEKHLWWMGVKK